MRIGSGFDAHRFAGDDRPLWLACLEWPGEGPGIDGDSDGDVVAHALIDALLSACRAGDIGSLFGVGANARGAGMHGAPMLRETLARVRDLGFAPVNAVVTVIGNRPKVNRRRAEAQDTLSALLGCPVSLSATTTDGMGFTGRGEGIAAQATVLLHCLP
ncbi:2-C-methyl-D-erythritol 2,4-cyclodiphosphate synthase [Bifidobacterium sp. BRDM6]|uniref:2-C-methyl-D-erythritol 2,4-cyclodiphosphate synthase n=1 Tax=Bifidobacterium choloepi TaxID=2614131 RepID=A0A6I5N9Y1_9BIFI|nr:2-C-methyl-D-erythritol 2,4-cyclodiphosphate synthase [Bifidobacterium choloepi]